MEIFKDAGKPDEFCIMKCSSDEIINLKSICEQLSGSMHQLLKLPDAQFKNVVKSDVPIDQTKEEMRKLIATCGKYYAAFVAYNVNPIALNINFDDGATAGEDNKN